MLYKPDTFATGSFEKGTCINDGTVFSVVNNA